MWPTVLGIAYVHGASWRWHTTDWDETLALSPPEQHGLGLSCLGNTGRCVSILNFWGLESACLVPSVILRPKRYWMKDFFISWLTWTSWVTTGSTWFKSILITQQLRIQWGRSQSCCMVTCQSFPSNLRFFGLKKTYFFHIDLLINQVMRAKHLAATTCASTGNLNWRHGLQTLHRAVSWSQLFPALTTSMMGRSI